jgi:hypothetical protein
VQLKFLGVEWRPRAWNGIDSGGSGKAGENENMDPAGQAEALFLWFDTTSVFGRSTVHVPHPIKVARGRAPSSLCLELGVLIGFESMHYRFLYAGR